MHFSRKRILKKKGPIKFNNNIMHCFIMLSIVFGCSVKNLYL